MKESGPDLHYTEAARIQREEERQRFDTHIKTLEIKAQRDQELLAQQQQAAAIHVKDFALLQAEKNQSEESRYKTQEALQVLQSNFEALKNQHVQLQSQQAFTAKQHEKVTEEFKLLSSRYQDLQTNFSGNTERLKMTETALKEAEDEMVLLRDKLLFLTHEKAQLQAQCGIYARNSENAI